MYTSVTTVGDNGLMLTSNNGFLSVLFTWEITCNSETNSMIVADDGGAGRVLTITTTQSCNSTTSVSAEFF